VNAFIDMIKSRKTPMNASDVDTDAASQARERAYVAKLSRVRHTVNL
jgi:hypothetical protein